MFRRNPSKLAQIRISFKTKMQLVKWLVIFLHLGTFILSRVIYNYVLQENGKAQFDNWADFFYIFPGALFIPFFAGPFLSQQTTKRNEVVDILPETRRLIELFENALKRNVPERHEKVVKFSRYVLLTWLLTMREFSKLLKDHFSNCMLIQKVLKLTDMERHALEKFEKDNIPMGDAIHGLLRTMVKHMESSCHLNTGEAKILDEAVNNFKRNCDGVPKFFERKPLTVRFTWVSCFALHAFGWLSVFGIKKEMMYFFSAKSSPPFFV
ncbi:hypothetical protein GHT06_008508 [Daphnia sinensis]|uniref:Bestrophin homolog n=1 Tax=Daphnia sinensis TaxID=1820382 RepID=A0AAD5PZ11_9CRUS|nr:hypothetical protein GHT06_008508 [Daphnia sinensis]